jgi:glycosyltransferase involved in cell wall biosynthesis
MNILMITHLYHPRIGGVESCVKNLCRELQKKGHNVEIVTSRLPKNLPQRETINEVMVNRLPFRLASSNPLSILKFIIRASECIVKMLIIVRNKKIDIINLHYISENAIYALMLSYMKRISLITSIHGSDIENASVRGRMYEWVVRRTLKRSAKVISNSNYLLLKTIEKFNAGIDRKSIIIGNGVDISEAYMLDKYEEAPSPFILGIGRLEHYKGFDILIRSVAFMLRSYPDIKLILAGDGPERRNLEILIKKLGIEESVLMYGLRDRKDIQQLLASCKFLVVPSRREAFGIVILEAMAARRAVIAMEVGGVSDLIKQGENGILIKNHDPNDLAEAMTYLLEHPEIADALGKRGRSNVIERFDWKIIADKYIAAFQSTI